MKKLDQSYWESRYINHDTPWQLESVSSPLKWIIDELQDENQRILIPGGGNSQEAIYLLEKGLIQLCSFYNTTISN